MDSQKPPENLYSVMFSELIMHSTLTKLRKRKHHGELHIVWPKSFIISKFCHSGESEINFKISSSHFRRYNESFQAHVLSIYVLLLMLVYIWSVPLIVGRGDCWRYRDFVVYSINFNESQVARPVNVIVA